MPLKRLEARAFAKVNLGLEILGKRPDGYHELRTFLQTIDLHDELSFELTSPGSGIRLTTSAEELPTDERNLVYRAAALLAEEASVPPDVTIHVAKHVPMGAGLGGGSADAAVTLLALDRLWALQTRLPDLHRLASRLGMDVPFFLHGGTALGVGRGDELYPVRGELDLPIVLILPDFSIATSDVYRNLRLTKKLAGLTLSHFAWSDPRFQTGLGELVNDLEGATGEHSTSIQELKQLLLGTGASISMMSGSGSTVFGVFEDESRARTAERSLQQRGVRAVFSRTVDGLSYREKLFAVR